MARVTGPPRSFWAGCQRSRSLGGWTVRVNWPGGKLVAARVALEGSITAKVAASGQDEHEAAVARGMQHHGPAERG